MCAPGGCLARLINALRGSDSKGQLVAILNGKNWKVQK